MSELISVEKLKKTFKIPGGEDIEVLKGIDVEFSAGQFISIMGASGSGKLTEGKGVGGSAGAALPEIQGVAGMNARTLGRNVFSL